ncbi:MAG: hypothetical protein KJ726_10730, partial [Verrucomicrobia bacterium]|nr:hypothetical protein [Verrucomicrobiota bacterium]
ADQTDPSDPSSVPSAPAITHTPLANPQARPAPWPVAAVVTDNCQVAAVTLWWQRNADAWQSAAMSTSAVPNQYTNAIPAPGVNGDTFNYYLTAGDAAGLVNTGAVCNFSVEYALMRPAPTNLGNVWMFSNSQTSMNVSVSNAGAAVLAWNAQVSTGGVGWLTLAPTNGGLSPGSVTGVAVTINSAGFTAGVSRTGQVIFRGNDPVTPTSAVPVTLRVGAAPVIAHTPPGNTTNTADPYPLDATLTPTALVNTNAAFVYWSTNDGLEFATAQLVRVSGDLFRANVPAQPAPTRVSYSLQAAATNGLIARLPTNAPAALFSFEVTLPVSLVITGTPPVAEVVPPYGESAVASGYVCQAYAKSDVPADGGRYVCTGWLGSGSAPVSGGGTSVTFTVREPTVLDWQWRREWALTQTSAPAGLLATTTWWTADSTGQTVVATESLTQDATNYRFAGWRLDGQRQPAETGRVVNPVPAILMSTSRVAVASYLPEDEDEDADGLPDWWELFYFGDTGQDSGYDADGDSFTNGQELADRTDPSDPLSTPGAPVIQHTSLADPQTAPAPWPVSAVATDNYAIAAVTLWWEINGGGWNSSAMTRVEPTDLYTNAIPAPGVQGDHVEYFIEATDPAGWGTTNGPYTFEVAYPVFVVTPTNLELNWLMPGEEWPLALALTNSGNAATSWRLDTQMAGLEDDVESGAGGWTHTDAGDLWRITTNRSISPDHAWYSGHFGTPGYDDNMDCRLVSPTLWIVQGARLRFGYWIQTEVDAGDPPYAYDGGLVEISTNDGASFQSIEPVGGYPAVARGLYGSPFEPNTPFFAGTGGWQSAEFDLSAYAGREVRLAFRFGSDESFAEGEGWYVDDIVLTPAGGTDQWFTASATDGVVNADSGAGVTVDLDAQDLSAGESRGAILTFTSDDPVRPAVHIPLSLFVGPPVTLDHTPLLNTTNTVDAYAVRVTAEPLGPMPEGEPRLRLLWNSVSPFGPFETNTLVYDADNVWTGAIPAHPLGARLYYFLHAEAGAAYAFHPAGAPAVVHSFDVTGPAELVVEGFITTYGSPTPPYGTITLAAGTPVNAEAPDELYGGTWRTCTGWVGTGSVPAIGGTNRVSFVIETNSLLRWQWLSQVRMTETSMPAGIIQTVRWWKVATYASTVEAEAQVPWDGTTYRFAEWRLNGARQPPTGRATFSVTGIVMYAPQSAAALYLPEAQDADDDGLADWWEYFEFGTMATDPGADPDVDGFTNYEEFMEETDPHDPASKPAPPVIQHTPLADPQTGAAPWEVAAVVTDNFALARVPLAGQALRFDGEDDYVMRNPVTRFPSNEITVEFWMLSSDRTDRGTPFSYAMSGTFDDANEFTLFNYNTFLIYRGATYVDTDVAATDGAWHHMAVTWRSADGQARLFKDGVEAWSGALAAGQDIRPGGALVFGQDQDSLGGGFSAQDAFDGLLDEMRVWSVIRTPEQIAAQMTNRLTGAESGLVGYWRFDEGSGAIAGDSSGGGMAGTVSGAVWTNSTAFSGGDVRLHWSRDGGTWQESIMSAGPSNRFVEWIPAPGRHGETYSYRLEARDMAGLIATNGPHEFGVELPLLDVTPSYADYWIRPATSQVESLVVSNAGVGDLAWTVAVEPMGFSDDVESGTNGWTHAGNNEAWHITMQRAASGSRSWYQGDESTGTYVDYMDASLVMPAIVLPPGASLSFRHWADTELRNSWIAWDGGIVEISTNGGMNYAQLTPEGGYPFIINGEWGSPFSSGIGCFAGAGGWTQAVFNLSAFGGQQVLLRFRFGSDQQNDYPPEGWFIDDVVITPSSGTNGWLTLALTNGALAGGAAVDLEPAFSSAGLAIGDVRAALLRFESNDPSALTNRQVVMMTVSEPPVILHSPLQNTLETNIPYGVEAVITSPVRLDTNALFLAWHTEGAGATGATTLLARVTNDLFAGAIPAQPGGTVVNYFCSAAEGAGLVSRHPEVGWHSFLVAEQPVFLTVTGTPSEAGVPTPAYGVHPMASGVVVSASAEPGVPAGGSRLACQGWTGTGSVPAAGGTNTVSFT